MRREAVPTSSKNLLGVSTKMEPVVALNL
jgi:hypothetical protein